MLTFHYWHCVRDMEYEQPFCKIKDLSKIEAHPMQFTVWRFSPKARTLIEFIVTLIFATIIHLLVESFFNQIPRMVEYVANLEEAEAELALIVDRASEEYGHEEDLIKAFRYSFEP